MMKVSLACVLCMACLACGTQPQQTDPPAVTNLTAVQVSTKSAAQVEAAAHPIEAVATAAHHCEGSPAQCQQNAAPPAPRPAPGGELYGASMDSSIELTKLSDLLARPKDFADNRVRTTGTIGRVCQHRGCWMELRSEGEGAVARVPMAGHAFFVPSDSSGRVATVQGVVSVREGTENPLRIDATSVLIARTQ